MPVRSIKKSGSSVVGGFPSRKLEKTMRYESTLERDLLYFLEFDLAVLSYEPQPFTIHMTLEDGKTRSYTPDFLIKYKNISVLIEVKPANHLDKESTKQQIEIGTRWSAENNHLFRVITDEQIRNGPRLNNLKLLFRYSRIDIPFNILMGLDELFPVPGAQIPFGIVASHLMPTDQAHCKPYLWSLIFSHYLFVNLNQKLSDEILVSKNDRRIIWRESILNLE